MRRGNYESGACGALARQGIRDSPGSPVVADDRGSPFCEQPRKQTVATADVQDMLPIQIAQQLFNSGKMQSTAKGIIFDVIGVIRHLVKIGHGAILAAEPANFGAASGCQKVAAIARSSLHRSA